MRLRDLFDIVADAYEEGRIDDLLLILGECGPAGQWYWVIGPERGRPKQHCLPRSDSFWVRTRMMIQQDIERAQDIAAYSNLDAEAELVSAIAREIACEIDEQVINDAS